MDETIRVGLYARVSSERQAEELTVQSQLDALRRRIAQDQHRLEDEMCFVDEGYTGSMDVRPALERLRDVASCAGIDRLYVHSPDRLARDYVHQMVLLEEWRKHGVDVVFLNDIDAPQSPEGKLLRQVQGMIAEYERTKILERTRRGRLFAARQGKVSVLGAAPYGYRYVCKNDGAGEARYEIDDEPARWVRAMFTWVALEGLSLGDVVRRLAEHGVPTASGKERWDRATIRGILKNPAYIGEAKYGKTRLLPRQTQRRAKRGDPEMPRRPKVAKPTTPDEQESIAVPALVSAELFQHVAEQLDENRRHYRAQNKGASFLLSGLLVCQVCGSAYCGRRQKRTNKTVYVYYRCLGADKYRHGGEAICANGSVNGVAEETVWSDLCSLLQEPERLREEFERRLQRPCPHASDIAHAEQAIVQLKRRIARLIDAYENGSLDKGEFEPRIRRAKERLAQEQATLTQHQDNASDADELRLLVDQFETFADQINKGLDQADFNTKRNLLRLLIKRIEVDRQELRIVYKIQPRPFAKAPANAEEVLQHCLKFCVTASR